MHQIKQAAQNDKGEKNQETIPYKPDEPLNSRTKATHNSVSISAEKVDQPLE
jgi:hypothetical protein